MPKRPPARRLPARRLPATRAASDATAFRHRLTLHVGFVGSTRGEVDANVPGLDASADLNVTFGLGYAYALTPAWSVGASARLLRASASTRVSFAEGVSASSAVVPVLAGVRYRPLADTNVPVRPFLGVHAGPYIGTQAVSGTAGFTDTSASSTTETTPGAYLHAGVDMALGRRVVLAAAGGYHLVQPFSTPIGDTRDPSGFAADVSVGVRF